MQSLLSEGLYFFIHHYQNLVKRYNVYYIYLCYINLLNYCVEGMMSSIGHTTRATGTPCWPAGIDAQTFDFGTIWNNDPEDMVNSKYMIINTTCRYEKDLIFIN